MSAAAFNHRAPPQQESLPFMLQMQDVMSKSMRDFKEGSIVKGRILEMRPREVLVDIGYKSEGVIPQRIRRHRDLEVGDEVEVLLERLENDEGMVILSKEKAAYRQNWEKIVKVFPRRRPHQGQGKGGRQRRPHRQHRRRGVPARLADRHRPAAGISSSSSATPTISRSSRSTTTARTSSSAAANSSKQERAEKRQKFLEGVKVGDTVKGAVKNLTDFGAFIDLDGMDGLLHITDMTWGRLGHPSELLKVGQELDVLVLDINKEKERVSLGLKQTQKNPWDEIEERFPAGQKVKGKVTNLVPYGAFVEIEEGVEGLIHVSELSWTKRITRPSDVLTVGQEVEAVVLGVNKEEQKISLGVRQLEPNPWDEIEQRFTIGSQVKGTGPQHDRLRRVRRTRRRHRRHDPRLRHELDPKKINHPIGSPQEGRRSRGGGHRHRQDQPAHQPRHQAARATIRGRNIDEKYKIGDLVKGKVTKLASFGAFVQLQDDIDGLVHISQISEDRVDEGQGRSQGRPGSRSPRHQGRQDRAPHRSLDQGRELLRGRLKREAEAFDTLRPGEDMVGLEQAFEAAEEEYRPGEGKKK